MTTDTQMPTIAETDLADLHALTRIRVGDLIRVGSTVTTQEYGWGSGDTACALAAAGIGLKQMREA